MYYWVLVLMFIHMCNLRKMLGRYDLQHQTFQHYVYRFRIFQLGLLLRIEISLRCKNIFYVLYESSFKIAVTVSDFIYFSNTLIHNSKDTMHTKKGFSKRFCFGINFILLGIKCQKFDILKPLIWGYIKLKAFYVFEWKKFLKAKKLNKQNFFL